METHIRGEKHVTSNLGEVPQRGMIEHFRLEVDRKNAFDHGICGVNPTVSPSELEIITETKDCALFSVFRFAHRCVEVVVESIDEALASRGACRFQTLSEAG